VEGVFPRNGTSFRRGTAHAPALIAVREKLFLVPEDRQCHQGDRNNPQNDVFATAFFFCHEKKYTTAEIAVQVPR
jgi:hypothetical protein